MKTAIATILTRVFVTLMGLFTTMAVGQRLGTHGLGEVSLIVLAITWIMVLNNMIGGGALVWFTPRVARGRLLPPVYLWALGTMAIATVVMRYFPFAPQAYMDAVLVLAALQCIYTAHVNILLGQENLTAVNVIAAVQALVLWLAFLLNSSEVPTAGDYVVASLVAFGSSALLSSIALFAVPFRRRRRSQTDDTDGVKIPERGSVFPLLLKQGGYTQGANALQLLTYRLNYYLIDKLTGTATLGLFSVATQLAEGSWIAPRGLGMLVHSRVSNAGDGDRARDLTLLAARASVVLAALVLGAVLLVPDAWYRELFGKEVRGVRTLILLLAPGMLCMALSQAFSHWCSGTARNRHNTIASGIGLVVAAVLGSVCVPAWGLKGAALTSTGAYAALVAYQLVVFMNATGARWSRLLPDAGDLDRILQLVRDKKRR